MLGHELVAPSSPASRKSIRPEAELSVAVGSCGIEQKEEQKALLRYAEARHDGAVISAWAQIAMANSSKATANRRFAGSSVASS